MLTFFTSCKTVSFRAIISIWSISIWSISSPAARWFFLLLFYPSLSYEIHLIICKTDIFVSFLSNFSFWGAVYFTFLSLIKLCNTSDNLQDGSFCSFFSFHLFILRCRWLKKRIRLSRHAKKESACISRENIIFQWCFTVPFCGFSHDTSGWF